MREVVGKSKREKEKWRQRHEARQQAQRER